jgi:signal peptidase I
MFSLSSSTSEETTILPDAESTQSEPEHENGFVEMIRFSIIALMIVIPIRMFVAQPFIVSGASMADTFHTGEYLIVDQVTYQFSEPKLGDVVIFRYPKDPSKYFIKRIIGVPGDTIVIEDAKVTITNETYPEGHTLNEPYIRTMTPAPRLEEVLGEREYFVMGDNRDESSDSRVWGVLQEERIIGRALIRLFPFGAFDTLPGAFTEEMATTVSN